VAVGIPTLLCYPIDGGPLPTYAGHPGRNRSRIAVINWGFVEGTFEDAV
jgi:hypothetical protein